MTSMLKECFVISPIGDPESEFRVHADKVLKHIITPPLKDNDFSDPIRADKIDESGIITTQIIQKIVSCDLVIADLSYRNPNVFYELSIRHAAKKPFIQLIRSGEQIPFDIAVNRTISFDLTDLDSVDSAKSQVSSQIKAFNSGESDLDNPISIAIELKDLRTHEKGRDKNLANAIELMSTIAGQTARIDRFLQDTIGKDGANLRSIIDELGRYRTELRLRRRRNEELRPERYASNTFSDEHTLYNYVEIVSNNLIRTMDDLSGISPDRKRIVRDRLHPVVAAIKALQRELIPF